MSIDVTIRSALEEDQAVILRCVRDAFSDDQRDGQQEVDIVTSTWAKGASVPDLELVAIDDGKVIGHVLTGRGDLSSRAVFAVAPLAVMPTHQNQGVGSALMRELLRRAELAELPFLVLLGDAAFYGRFGFEESTPLGIVYRPFGSAHPHFLIRRLSQYDPSFQGDFTYCWESKWRKRRAASTGRFETWFPLDSFRPVDPWLTGSPSACRTWC
jgi:putative acetyltransferase